MPHERAIWLELVLATPVVLWGGWPFFVRGWRSIVQLEPQHVHADRAWAWGWPMLYSLVATLFPRLFPASFRDADGRWPSTSKPPR